ncbi:cortical protein KAR9-domain-containing protein [Xylogone sp. PMI_703]|nr:cortical protein KAR9-domain-containing protein [Xylogone sp. PMI_703]
MQELRDGSPRADPSLSPSLVNRPTSSPNTLQLSPAATSPGDQDREQRRRQPRKPSPGLAARLKALGFGREHEKSPSPTPSHDHIGRIPEDQIRQLDSIYQANSRDSPVPKRGRAWSGVSGTHGYLTPQVTGGSGVSSIIDFTPGSFRTADVRPRQRSSSRDSVDRAMATYADEGGIDSHKYILPDHTNGNGTKASADVKQAHIERDTLSPSDRLPSPPPPPPPKDTPPDNSASSEFSVDAPSYFNPFGLQRTGSIYTLSRVSFASQLAQLTSLQLPDAESLSTKVSAIPTSKAASRALMGAAEQIRSWISKASEVIAGLDSEDDVEWAAAGGREGLEDVDSAITRFEELITVYVSAIEDLQNRADIATVPTDELTEVVTQVESILSEWGKIRSTLRAVKNSVEIAMEWEELWNTVLGDIGNEMDVLARLVFEMEEKRHKSMLAETSGDGVDITELETIVEETPPQKSRLQANRFGMPTTFPLTPNSPNASAMAQDDSSLLALFARMQPLRASLDFLPMRLSTFHARAEDIFPTACEELEMKREGLEASWKKLEKDAESLRRELGEDRWVLVFRGAGRQAQKMYESVERSLAKVKEAIDSGLHLNNPAAMIKRLESYEAKKTYYGPAIERVLSIIEKGVKDRLTVNGEILRLHSDMQNRWAALKEQMSELDMAVEELQAEKKSQQLRDSISSLVSNDQSTIGSLNDTPGSSPASSVIMNGLSGGLDSTPANGKPRSNSKTHLPQPSAMKSAITPSANRLSRKSSSNRLSVYSSTSSGALSPTPSIRNASKTPTGNRLPRPSNLAPDGRPRWNSSTNIQGTIIGHNFKPLSLTTPSPHAKTPIPVHSKLPLRSPVSRDSTNSPAPESTPTKNTKRFSQRDISSPGPYSRQVLSASLPPRYRSPNPPSTTSNTHRRVSLQPTSSNSGDTGVSPPAPRPARPASSLAGSSRRSSLLPQPRGRTDSSVTGRESPHAIRGAQVAMKRGTSQASTDSKGKDRQPWR